MAEYDVLVAGGGPAGSSAALILGRSRRSVLVCDGGEPRNSTTDATHSFLTRDGTPPRELRRIAREQLSPYASVVLTESTVEEIAQQDGHFVAKLGDGREVTARKVILATGVHDELPAIEGLAALWGKSIFHCPYCDGWEIRDQPLAVYAKGEAGMQLAPLIRQWSRDLVLLTDGPATLSDEQCARLRALGIELHEAPIARFEGAADDALEIVFADGSVLPRVALFLEPVELPRTALARQLGCELGDEPPVPGLIRVDSAQQTTVPGVYAAGDVAFPMHQVALAAGSGGLTGISVNYALVQDDLSD